MESVEDILTAGIENGLARDGLFIGIGGGVVCDMTAFAASIYMRGSRVILIPTTLLAMTDASLGGKTGVDFRGYKNMAGTFFPAEELRICPDLLSSLPERDYISGLAEVIKHAFLVKSDLFEFLEREREAVLLREPQILGRMIRESIKVKGDFVERDFREQAERAFLNFGHTFGHALESVSGFAGWSHGEAVAWGMDKALKAGVLMGETDPDYARKVSAFLALYGFRLEAPGIDPEALINAMGKDKKKREGKIMFVLQKEYGKTFQSEIPRDILQKVLA
ncbi:MAG: 3-dehydroquinate synthase [Spirochaetales bacterium]|nr:3-dehydroquinate synthase [Spirochaetales bacterium]